MEQDQPAEQATPAEFQIADTSDMSISQWERVKAQYQAAGYQYVAGLVVFRHVPPSPAAGGPGALSVVPPPP
jgi:hypothetical protein